MTERFERQSSLTSHTSSSPFLAPHVSPLPLLPWLLILLLLWLSLLVRVMVPWPNASARVCVCVVCGGSVFKS
jgi:hypothetical protein